MTSVSFCNEEVFDNTEQNNLRKKPLNKVKVGSWSKLWFSGKSEEDINNFDNSSVP